jgi:hypothetical protein
MFGRENTTRSVRNVIPHWVQGDVAQARFAGESEMRKTDFGTGRSGTRERAAFGIPRRIRRSRARSKYAASPGCRTFRNARTRHIPPGSPRRKNAWRRPGTARGGALPLQPCSPWRCFCENGADCRYGRRDTTNFLLLPGSVPEGYVKTLKSGKFHLRKAAASMYNKT